MLEQNKGIAIFVGYQKVWEVLFWFCWALFHALVNSVSVVDDFQRNGVVIATWEPYVWEFSSNFVSIALIPLVLIFDRRFSLNSPSWFKHLGFHLVFSLFYSLSHVFSMVTIREWFYLALDRHYSFGNGFAAEFFYEYRKDLMGYIGVLMIVYSYRFISARLIGEASVITSGEDEPEPEHPERLLVKKLGKEFIVKVIDIDWIEAAGNYMNLHIGGRTYPLRETMGSLQKRLDNKQFARVHRSFMVNMDRIDQIEPLESGDYKIHLKSGVQINFSRRYREALKGRFAQ